MKRIVLAMLMLFVLSTPLWAAGSVSGQNTIEQINTSTYRIVISCVGDASNGSIPDTTINPPGMKTLGLYLYRVVIENKSTWTTITDDSDVYIYDSGGSDLLGGQGVDQLDDDTRNYIRLNEYDPIIGPLTLDVDNQAEVSGVYTVTLILVK